MCVCAYAYGRESPHHPVTSLAPRSSEVHYALRIYICVRVQSAEVCRYIFAPAGNGAIPPSAVNETGVCEDRMGYMRAHTG